MGLSGFTGLFDLPHNIVLGSLDEEGEICSAVLGFSLCFYPRAFWSLQDYNYICDACRFLPELAIIYYTKEIEQRRDAGRPDLWDNGSALNYNNWSETIHIPHSTLFVRYGTVAVG